jgi:hypothetical protein
MTTAMTTIHIDLWVLLIGVALPSVCLLVISLMYCWRRLSRRQCGPRTSGKDDNPGFDRQVLLEMVLQQTDNAFNRIVETVQEERIQMLKVLETHQLALPGRSAAGPAADPRLDPPELAPRKQSADALEATRAVAPQKDEAAATPKRNIAPAQAALFDPYSQIPAYIHQGLTVPEVAACLDLPEAAVDLYVNLRMSATPDGGQKTA